MQCLRTRVQPATVVTNVVMADKLVVTNNLFGSHMCLIANLEMF